MAEWRFYGRERELAEVRSVIEMPGFRAELILGGRGIGKTELLEETRRRSGNNPPMLIFELRDPGIEGQVAANDRLKRDIRKRFGSEVVSSIPLPDELEAKYIPWSASSAWCGICSPGTSRSASTSSRWRSRWGWKAASSC